MLDVRKLKLALDLVREAGGASHAIQVHVTQPEIVAAAREPDARVTVLPCEPDMELDQVKLGDNLFGVSILGPLRLAATPARKAA